MERQRNARPRRQASSGRRDEQPSPARIVVPAALAICLLLVLVTFATAGKPDKGDDQTGTPISAKQEKKGSTSGDRTSRDATDEPAGDSGDQATSSTGPALYKVKAGDSFGAIAERTGVEADELADLNPDVDPRALQPGQQLKLR